MSDFDEAYWEGRYRSGEPTSREHVSPSLVAEAGALAPGSALEAGCGRGADARWLAEQGWQVTAVDVSATAVEAARGTDDRVEWLVADLTTWVPGERRFDLVTSHHVHVPGPMEDLVARLGSWVAPGGTLLVVGHAQQHGHGSGHEQRHGHGSEHEDGHEQGHEHGDGHGHDHGEGPPPAAQVDAAQLAAVLPPDAWEVVVAEPRAHTVVRPGTATPAVLHDVVVRARRRTG